MLTNQQKNQIGRVTDQLAQRLSEKEINADTVARELTALFGLTLSKAKDACGQMESAISAYRTAAAKLDLKKPVTAEAVLSAVTADMTPEERKGFCLTLYDGYRAADAKAVPEAAAAREDFELIPDHDEAALLNLAAQRLTIQGQAILEAASGTLPGEDAEAPHPLIHAAALYAAGVTGELDPQFAENPVLLGLGCGMAEAAAQLTQERAFNEDNASIIVALIALAVAVAIAIAGGPIVGKVSTDLLAALSSGGFAGLAADLLEVILLSLKYWLPGLLSFLGLTGTIKVGEALIDYYRPLAVRPTLAARAEEDTQTPKNKIYLPADARM